MDVALGAAVAMALVVVHHAAAQRGVGRLLVCPGDGGVNAVTPRIHVFGEALVQHLPHHFCYEFSAQGIFVGLVLDHERRLLRVGKLGIVEVAQFVHAPQHVELPLLGAFGVDHRVEVGRSLGQPGQHRRLGHIDVL